MTKKLVIVEEAMPLCAVAVDNAGEMVGSFASEERVEERNFRTHRFKVSPA